MTGNTAPRSFTFPRAEHERRVSRARAALSVAGLDACLVTAPANLFYLAGYDSWVGANSPQFMVFTPGDESPVIVLRDVDEPLAREVSWVTDLRTYRLHRDDVAAMARQVLADMGVTGGRVGVELQSAVLPGALAKHLESELEPFELVDATELLGDLRLVKSPAEIERLEEAARYARAGLDVLQGTLRPGITEIDLAAGMEHAMRTAGSDYWAIPTELASGWRSAGGHATPRNKVIEPGDVVHAELAGVSHRYHAVAIQTLALGDPGPRARELYDIALASLRAGLAAVEPGVPVSAVEEASLGPLRVHGLEDAAMMRFGYGIGVAYPPVWLETLQISRGFDRRLEPGMAMVLHSCLELPGEALGVIQGGTYLLEEQGLRMLVGAGDVELAIV